MFDDMKEQDVLLDENEAFSVLRELEKNTSEEIRRQRMHFRVSIKADIVLQSGNASQLLDYKVKGVTGDISEGGCSTLFPIPVHVGDVYRLSFDRSKADLPLTYARCVRCRLVRDGAYEAGFAFFSPISLPENLVSLAERS